MENYEDLEKFTQRMSIDILNKLNGSHSEFKRIELPDNPSKIIVLGTLGDRSTDHSEDKNDGRTLSSIKNNSMTVKFLVKKADKFSVSPSLSLFYRVYPNYEEEDAFARKKYDKISAEIDFATIWKRLDSIIPPIDIELTESNITIPVDLSKEINKILDDGDTWKGGTRAPSTILKSKQNFDEYIGNIPRNRAPQFDWSSSLQIQTEDFKQGAENLTLVSISFKNETEEKKGYETFLFNCHLSIELDTCEHVPFTHKYEYEGFEYQYDSYVRCLNCHADYIEDSKKIITKHFSMFKQEKIIPKIDVKSISFKFDDLAADSELSILKSFNSYMASIIDSYKNDCKYSNDREFKYRTDHLINLQNRYVEGLEALETNENAWKAFSLLNRTFDKASDYPGWRAFQIFFVVCLIPDVVDKTKRRDICEVLHVDTGGGKSEAYFGCVLFSAFWDRITGKEFGTTAITKFPLRMLSIQQLERIANIFIWGEEVRKDENLGGEPFSVGYYVGSSDEFPRHSNKLIEQIQKKKSEGQETKGKIIKICPLCKGKEVVLDVNPKRYIIHRCNNCGKEFNLFFTDEELYRLIPTFIISTVDKLAGISMNRRLKNIFGGKIDRCKEGHGYVPRNDTCEVQVGKVNCNKGTEQYDVSFSTAPTFMIQDEMHLIREGFGTIDSHFESLIENLEYKLAGYRPKYITMTATMTGAPQQIKHLYNKNITVYPGHSPYGKGIDDIFFDYEKSDADNNVAQRFIIGLKPNLRDNQFASLLTLKYISEFINDVESNLDNYSRDIDIDKDELEMICPLYKRILTYHNKKSDVHSMNYYLEAVVNSKLNDYKVYSSILTGDSTLDDIKDTINQVKDYYKESNNKKQIMNVSATSVVSHGVDISEWNFMIFQGIPRSTAEYIQALSRVGRRDVGIVFVWFYPNRTRDLSYYQSFEDYHSILDHKVEHVPLSRWAKLGFSQTFTSIFNASILNYYSDLVEEPLYKVEKVNEIFRSTENRKKLIEFIMEAYIADSSMTGAEFFRESIPREVEARLNYLELYTGGEKNFFPNALKDCDNKYFKTQYGMRGIQDEVILKPSSFDIPFLEKSMKGGN